MLTDIFADRYANAQINYSTYQAAIRFMAQVSRMITEQVFPLYDGETEASQTSTALKKIHSSLSMELGLDQLTARSGYAGMFTIRQQTTNFFKPDFDDEGDFNNFLLERLSFVELAFREFENSIKTHNAALMATHLTLSDEGKLVKLGNAFGIPMLQEGYAIEQCRLNNDRLRQNLHELGERFKKAGLSLTYSSGYIQFADDLLMDEQVKKPFWTVIADPVWKSVDHEMHVAIDLRDTGKTGAASSAAKALESAIKIISHEKGWNRGTEKGAAQFVDNLVSEKNGRFVDVWEANVLKNFFSEVRNNLQHGAGVAPVLVLTRQQDDWAIETCMSWIKSLVSRL